MKFVCLLTTVPNLSSARKLARGLLEKKLAACIQLVPHLESHYFWKGKVQKSKEILLIVKTRAAHFKKVQIFFEKNHPYEVPELVALPISSISSSYAGWMHESTVC